MDNSDLDQKYFIDPWRYNCPFCKRNHVSYSIVDMMIFHWSEKKFCYIYKIKCASCEGTSMHLSYEDLRTQEGYPKQYIYRFKDKIDIDSKMFFSQPSSFFTIDNRIPAVIRDLIFESEKSRQANLLVGSSACLRKAIYELLKHEDVILRDPKTNRANYQESIKKLEKKYAQVTPELFHGLGDIQELVSDHVHEDSWEAWDSLKLRFLIELTKTTLNEMYVIPDERKQNVTALSKLKSAFSNKDNEVAEKEDNSTEDS